MPTPFKWIADFVVTGTGGQGVRAPSVVTLPNGQFQIGYADVYSTDTDATFRAFAAGGGAGNASDLEGLFLNGAGVDGDVLSDGRRVYVWTESPSPASGDFRDVYAEVRYSDSETGAVNIDRFLVQGGAGEQIEPTVVANTTSARFAVLLNDRATGDAVVKFYSAIGGVLSSVNLGTATSYGDLTYPAVTMTALQNGNYAVFRDTGGSVVGQIYTSGGIASGAAINLTDSSGAEYTPVATTLADGRIAVVYYDERGATDGVSAQIFNQDGTSSIANIDVGTSPDNTVTGKLAVTALLDGRFVAVWVQAGDIIGQVMFADGTKDGAAFTVNTATAGTQRSPSIGTLSDGRFVVSWTDQNSGTDVVRATIFDPRETNVNMSGSSYADDLYGTSFNDAVYGGTGNDTVRGQGGSDYILGEAGNDSLLGGDATDLLYGGAGLDNLQGESGDDFVYGGVGDDTVSGAGGNDVLYGEAGNDFIAGDDGNDTVIGGDGNDSMYGYANDDAMDGGAGNDTVYAGLGNDFARGGDGADTIIGEDGNDTLYGDGGDDSLDGGIGADTFYGGTGNDFAQGGAGGDVLIGEAGQDDLRGGDDDDSIDGGADGDTLRGEGGNDFIQGQDGDDFIDGGANVDDLRGGLGNDTIIGGGGGDTMYGNGGNDVFRFAVGSGADAIVGWEDGLDRIDITTYAGATFANSVITQVGGDTRVTFVSGDSVLLIGVTAATITIADFIV